MESLINSLKFDFKNKHFNLTTRTNPTPMSTEGFYRNRSNSPQTSSSLLKNQLRNSSVKQKTEKNTSKTHKVTQFISDTSINKGTKIGQAAKIRKSSRFNEKINELIGLVR